MGDKPSPKSKTHNSSIEKTEDLQVLLKNLTGNAAMVSGGNWSVLVQSLKDENVCSVNNTKMQSASLIKLYIMGAVYERYNELSVQAPCIEDLLYSMITASDNSAANILVKLLGKGSDACGRKAITAYCKLNGYSYTKMERMLLAPAADGDNYTSVSDCALFLQRVFNGKLPHSDKMLSLLRQQKITAKIPSGVPDGVAVANKTGELDSVQNDAAIVFSVNPYILCIMAENLKSVSSSVRSIIKISEAVYSYQAAISC